VVVCNGSWWCMLLFINTQCAAAALHEWRAIEMPSARHANQPSHTKSQHHTCRDWTSAAATAMHMILLLPPHRQSLQVSWCALVCDGVWCGGVRWFMVVYGVVHTHTVSDTVNVSSDSDDLAAASAAPASGVVPETLRRTSARKRVATAPPALSPSGMMVCDGVRWCMVWWCAMVHGGIWCCSYTHSDPKPTFKPGPMESTAICYQLCTDVPYTHSRLGQKKSWIEHLRILKGHGQCATIANKAYKTLSR